MDKPNERLARPPFDRAKADLVLRTCDGVDFRVFKTILAVASPVFEDMFSLPQSGLDATVPDEDISDERAAIVPVSEHSQVIDSLLRLCYPIQPPLFTDLKHTAQVLEASLKYQMDELTTIMKRNLRGFIANNPLEVFVIAHQLGLVMEEKESKETWAKSTRHESQSLQTEWPRTIEARSYIGEMRNISAGAWFRFLKDCRDASSFHSLYYGFYGSTWSFMGPQAKVITTPLLPTSANPPSFGHYGDANLIVRSSDGVEFRIHRLIISLASTNNLSGTHIEERENALPQITLQEKSDVLGRLLHLCYPIESPDIANLDMAYSILQAAKKYGMTKPAQAAEESLARHIQSSPVRAFVIAVMNGWKEVATEAARCTIPIAIADVYVPEMETVSAEVYFHLLRYRHECRRVLSTKMHLTRSDWESFPNGLSALTLHDLALASITKRWRQFAHKYEISSVLRDFAKHYDELTKAIEQVELTLDVGKAFDYSHTSYVKPNQRS